MFRAAAPGSAHSRLNHASRPSRSVDLHGRNPPPTNPPRPPGARVVQLSALRPASRFPPFVHSADIRQGRSAEFRLLAATWFRFAAPDAHCKGKTMSFAAILEFTPWPTLSLLILFIVAVFVLFLAR